MARTDFIQTSVSNFIYEEKTLALIQQCFGAECAKYVANKHTGGKSGRKGGRYEELFMAFKAAEIAAEHVELPATSWPFLAGQRLNFVDDVVISSDKATEYFQLKNSNSVSWGSGEKSIADDFSKQFILATELGLINPWTYLIVSSESLRDNLLATIPDEIKSHTGVGFFPYDDKGTVNSLVVGNMDVQTILAKIVCDERAPLDTLESALNLISVACNEHPDGCSVENIIMYIQTKHPGKLRLFPVYSCDQALTEDFVSILAKITGLSYGISRGYFNWSGCGMSGFYPHDCFSYQFKKFQERIVAAAPATFDDFEKLI